MQTSVELSDQTDSSNSRFKCSWGSISLSFYVCTDDCRFKIPLVSYHLYHSVSERLHHDEIHCRNRDCSTQPDPHTDGHQTDSLTAQKRPAESLNFSQIFWRAFGLAQIDNSVPYHTGDFGPNSCSAFIHYRTQVFPARNKAGLITEVHCCWFGFGCVIAQRRSASTVDD